MAACMEMKAKQIVAGNKGGVKWQKKKGLANQTPFPPN